MTARPQTNIPNRETIPSFWPRRSCRLRRRCSARVVCGWRTAWRLSIRSKVGRSDDQGRASLGVFRATRRGRNPGPSPRIQLIARSDYLFRCFGALRQGAFPRPVRLPESRTRLETADAIRRLASSCWIVGRTRSREQNRRTDAQIRVSPRRSGCARRLWPNERLPRARHALRNAPAWSVAP